MAVETRHERFGRDISKDDLKQLARLRNVKLNTACILGQGSYGTVYKAEHDGIVCAAKQLDLSDYRTELLKQNFMRECLQHSKLSHPNIVKMLGVFYPKNQAKREAILPVLVMELMEYNLTQLLKKYSDIPMYVKLSILQDVSRGLCYLHGQNPPIVHQALYSDNILFTKSLTAKIGDFKTGAETVSDQALVSVRPNTGSKGFLPNSCSYVLKYDMPLNVFSFGCIICHIITQEWPKHTLKQSLLHSYNLAVDHQSFTDDWHVEKYQGYIDVIGDYSLKQLVESCLQSNPKNRPPISHIYEETTRIMTSEPDL